MFDQLCFREGLKPKNLPCSLKNPTHSCPFPHSRPPALDMAKEGTEELVRRIIRSAQEGVNTSRTNVASNVSTPDEELRWQFNLPRRSETTTSSTNSCSTSTETLTSLQYTYNPQQNYGHTNPRRQRRQAPYYSRNRGRPVTRPQTATAPKYPPTLKEAILLPKPPWGKVPKYAKKTNLQEKGFILDCFPIERHWSESKLKERLTVSFV